MLEPVSLADIRDAQARIAGDVLRTPLVRLTGVAAPAEIWLKLESLQPVGSFKLRGAANAMRQATADQLAWGVWTASAGNMGQGLAWCAREMGIRCTVLAYDSAPQTKLRAIERLGASVLPVSHERYWEAQCRHELDGISGLLVHPFADPAVMAGNGTIALEILDDLPAVDAILVPYGGGGLSCGIASAVDALAPRVQVYACEVSTGAPLAPSLAKGQPVTVSYAPSFVSGIGASFVFPQMWPLASRLLDGALVATLPQVSEAMRVLADHAHLIVEGAGAVALATALSHDWSRTTDALGRPPRLVCIVSGGCISLEEFGACTSENRNTPV